MKKLCMQTAVDVLNHLSGWQCPGKPSFEGVYGVPKTKMEILLICSLLNVVVGIAGENGAIGNGKNEIMTTHTGVPKKTQRFFDSS